MTPATSHGFSVVEFAEDIVGFSPLPWQRWLMIHGLELLPDGRYRFRKLLVLVARQNGKTSIVEIKNLWKMYVQGANVLGTAQDLDVSEESWDNAVEICEGIPELAAEIRDVVKVNGKKALKLGNGARWKVKATNRRGGRGFSADDINLDELREHQTWDAWGAVTKTMLARRRAQTWAYTNAGDRKSVVLNDLQATARAAALDPDLDLRLGLFEWSVPDDVACTCGRVRPNPHSDDCRLSDVALWAMANPSLGYTVEEESLRSDLNTDPDVVFLTECLCQNVPDLGGGVLNEALWLLREDRGSSATGRVGVAVDSAPGGVSAAISMAGFREDGKRHWQVLDHYPGDGWVVEKLVAHRDNGLPFGDTVGVISGSPAASLVDSLESAGFTVVKLSSGDIAAAWGAFSRAVREDDGRHIGQGNLRQAIADARTAPSGDTERFSRKKSDGDITPIVSLTAADHVLRVAQPDEAPVPLFAFG